MAAPGVRACRDGALWAGELADGLDVKGEGAPIKVALNKSAAALDRLEACHARNGSATERNPFVAPSGKP